MADEQALSEYTLGEQTADECTALNEDTPEVKVCPLHTWDDLSDVLDTTRQLGIRVVMTETGRRSDDTAEADLAFCVSREAITNAIRHGHTEQGTYLYSALRFHGIIGRMAHVPLPFVTMELPLLRSPYSMSMRGRLTKVPDSRACVSVLNCLEGRLRQDGPRKDGACKQLFLMCAVRGRPMTNGPDSTDTGSNKIGVMIVDDQQPTRLGFQLMLRHDEDIRVMLEASDGQQALDRLEQASKLDRQLPDVVLMDVRMPHLDGIDATAALVHRWPQMHVLILTTYDEDDYAFGALEAGASGFLLKDVRSGELCRAVRSVAAGDAILTPRITREVMGRALTPVPAGSEQERLQRSFRGLTEREREICSCVAEGLSNAGIAEQLCIQPASAKRAVVRILAKLELRDRVQIAVSWYKAGL